ncbi:hypothetical protein GUJ93_ZPchr0001g31440, partial [Zizania palustris]
FAMLMSQATRMEKSPKVTATRDIEETFAYQVQDNVGARVDSFEEVENIGSNEHRAERVMEP